MRSGQAPASLDMAIDVIVFGMRLTTTTKNSPVTVGDRTVDLDGLLTRVSIGDQAALTVLYEQTLSRVYAIAMRILRDEQSVADVIGDVYFDVWSRPEKFDPARGTVIAWLMMKTRSKAIDRIRQTRRQQQHQSLDLVEVDQIEDPSNSAMDLVHTLEQNSITHTAMLTLTTTQRRLISLAYFQGLSHAEMAEATGIPLGTVKSHVRRGLQTLKKSLNDIIGSSDHIL